MKKFVLTTALMLLLSVKGFSQEWVVPLGNDSVVNFRDLIAVDGGENVLCVGHTSYELPKDGGVVKVSKNGEHICRVVHHAGKRLRYYSAVQLPNGNYMAFGVSDDSLCDPYIQKYLCVDIFNSELELVSSKMHYVDDDVFDCFFEADNGHTMKSTVIKTGNALLAARLSYYVESTYGGYYTGALRFYEFDEHGDVVRMVDDDPAITRVGSIKEVAKAPHSDNLIVIVNGGIFPPHSGCSGMLVVDTTLHIVSKQHMLNIGVPFSASDVACEGKWIAGEHLILDIESYEGSSFVMHNLYKVDSSLNVYANLRLPPYDSCTWVPFGTSTAYINDSTIFAFSYSSLDFLSLYTQQANVVLVDKDLNLLGRKVFKHDDIICIICPPAAFNDGGCLILLSSYSGQHYQGDPVRKHELMKLRREDIEITWDVVQEKDATNHDSPYPNPTDGIINIPISEGVHNGARVQLFDMKGVKCFDSAVKEEGNLITIDAYNLENGLYVYKVVSKSAILSEGKFVKE